MGYSTTKSSQKYHFRLIVRTYCCQVQTNLYLRLTLTLTKPSSKPSFANLYSQSEPDKISLTSSLYDLFDLFQDVSVGFYE